MTLRSPGGESARWHECPLHGRGVRPEYLVGRWLAQVFTSRHRNGAGPPSGPLDAWLIDGEGGSTRITIGTDWCLIVETSAPHEGYDMGEWGRVEVAPVHTETPFANHVGETVLAIREEGAPATGRLALEITFPSGRVRCESWAGDLRLSTG
ncbi:hypothetical protein [Streptomyces litchfieldiae]|uniref:Uncharacterized protein n=1 Tax=Streptomyces litchfieldiae TaxID=3075543 RepID=A0ABU2MQB8_9ACTN|nr:hypothetical protein [Streptomyces sp. DSM 44938]MDT0343666.1 hypothetical protein [Streptomyces sp. DSM 44938]